MSPRLLVLASMFVSVFPSMLASVFPSVLVSGLVSGLAACSGDPADRPRTFGGDRPVTLDLPANLDDGAHYPLVIALHGYSISGYIQQAYLGLRALTDAGRVFLVAPTGNMNSQGKPYWNADEACCDYDHASPDDVGYLAALIDDIAAAWPVDRAAVFAIGQGNGGNMAYRLACDRAELLAGIVVIAGAAGIDPAACAPARPVSVLHLHGTADPEFAYAGGGPFQQAPEAPGAVESVTRWAGHDGCALTRTAGAPLDLDASIAGAETHPERFGCAAPTAVELWTMEGTDHLPNMVDAFSPAIWPWLDARRAR